VKKELIIILSVLIVFSGCSIQKEPPEFFISELEKIKLRWAHDNRTSVFDIDHIYEGGKWKIKGETTIAEAQKAIVGLVQKAFSKDNFDLDFKLLPPHEFGDTTNALVKVSVGNLRRSPKHSAELVDQVLMGMSVKLVKTKSDWYLVQTPTDYLGWITRSSITRLSNDDLNNWKLLKKYVLMSNYEQIFSKPSENSQVVSDLVLGSVFIEKSKFGSWMEIELPDGRTGYVKSRNVKTYQEPDNTISPDRDRLIERAKTMIGIPYMWGGHSTKAFDCSGYTETVFRTEGIQLPRDASMQVRLGEEVIPDSSYGNVLPADLIFFGPPNRITHVGISLGGSYFIHADGDVHISSLDENDELFNPSRKKTLRFIKRFIKN
jgi:uncharacterized protein YgiM (DUF1202 family)